MACALTLHLHPTYSRSLPCAVPHGPCVPEHTAPSRPCDHVASDSIGYSEAGGGTGQQCRPVPTPVVPCSRLRARLHEAGRGATRPPGKPERHSLAESARVRRKQQAALRSPMGRVLMDGIPMHVLATARPGITISFRTSSIRASRRCMSRRRTSRCRPSPGSHLHRTNKQSPTVTSANASAGVPWPNRHHVACCGARRIIESLRRVRKVPNLRRFGAEE